MCWLINFDMQYNDCKQLLNRNVQQSSENASDIFCGRYVWIFKNITSSVPPYLKTQSPVHYIRYTCVNVNN